MKWMSKLLALGLLVGALCPAVAIAADHRDGPSVQQDPSTDINDVYTWMSSDGSKVYLILTVFPAADASSRFSNAAWYVLHTSSRASFTSTTSTSTDVICGFDASQRISCWVGTDTTNFVTGDASSSSGLVSANNKIKVFAGLRKDHFFFNLEGFNNTKMAVHDAVTSGAIDTFDMNGCPMLSADLQAQLVNDLKSDASGKMPGTDFFLNLNTLAIVLELDRTLLNTGGPILSVWAGTYRRAF